MLLKELTGEKLKDLYKNNSAFKDVVYDCAYNNSMYWQGEEARELDPNGVLVYHDYYCSFYYTAPAVYGCTAPEMLAGKLNADYMAPENIELYSRLCDAVDKWEALDYD